MKNKRYPRLVIDLKAIADNYRLLSRRCEEKGISITVVSKGINSQPEVVRTLVNAGAKSFATSRLSQMEYIKDCGIAVDWTLCRIPQKSECSDVPKYCSVSLQSSIETVRELERWCARTGKIHNIIITKDLGDLREGYWDDDELLRDCAEIRDNCPHIRIIGISTIIADFAAVKADSENMAELVKTARKLEELLGYRLDVICGGSTTSYPLFHEGKMPEGINNLRIGESILLAYDLPNVWKLENLPLRDTMLLQAQIIEVRDKPSAPVGEQFVNGFGEKPLFEDRGMRRRAIVALGTIDAGNVKKLIPMEEGVKILGATSDHMMLDIQDCGKELKVGDLLEFRLSYEGMMFATASRDVRIDYER